MVRPPTHGTGMTAELIDPWSPRSTERTRLAIVIDVAKVAAEVIDELRRLEHDQGDAA
jgi:hypothetical protein